MKALKSQRVLLMEQAWKEAARRPDGVTFHFKTSSGAVRARMSMYNAVKEAKKGLGDDMALIDAAQNVEICWTNKEHTSFVMRSIKDSDFIQGVEEGLGMTLGQQVDPVIAEMEKLFGKPQTESTDPDLAPNYGPFAGMGIGRREP